MNDRTYNVETGIFRFYFWVKDGWYGTNISDELPQKFKNYSRYFYPWAAQESINGAFWLPLLEKAYAKLHQNYDRLTAGWGEETLRILTGMPTTTIHHATDLEVTSKLLKYWASKNYPMTNGCCKNGERWNGLISGHAYSLLDVKDGTDAEGNQITLAKVRNPWANEHYTGPWSDVSDLWTDDLQE